jgi:actin-related protein 4
MDYAKQQPGRVFEMPDGANQMWGVDRFSVAEGMWDSSAALPVPGEAAPSKAQTIPEMVRASIGAVDMDIRPHLLQNIVVTGGSTLVNGFTDRLHNELTGMYPGARIKIQAAGLTAERRFGSWIGGSILGSLGTFHQMWVSRKEYEEFGSNVVEKAAGDDRWQFRTKWQVEKFVCVVMNKKIKTRRMDSGVWSSWIYLLKSRTSVQLEEGSNQ